LASLQINSCDYRFHPQTPLFTTNLEETFLFTSYSGKRGYAAFDLSVGSEKPFSVWELNQKKVPENFFLNQMVYLDNYHHAFLYGLFTNEH
jgi:hypothetical protein